MAAAAAAPAAAAVGREKAEGGGGVPSPPLPPPPRGQRADDTLDEATRKELCTDTFCKVCGAVLQFESQRVAHYEGKRHAQKVRLYLQMHSEQTDGQEPSKQKIQYVNFQMDTNVDENTYCRLCNMIFTSPVVAQSHYQGKIHTKKLKRLSEDQAQQPTQNDQPEPAPSAVPSPPEPSVENVSQDTDAKDTSPPCKTTLDLEDPDKFCKLCSAPFNNPLMAHQHYVGKKHKRNEARKKLMTEMGSEAVPVESQANAVGVGKYICPICSISLTSIEMYQSHMQGNKHQIKETMISNLITNSKKAYGSFQDELKDYIKVQKARGLEPKTHFRKPEEFQNEEYGAMNGHEEAFAFDQDQFSSDANASGQHSVFFSETRPPSSSLESKLPHWTPAYRDPPKLENVPLSQHRTGGSLEKQAFPLDAYKSDNCNPSSSVIMDGYKPVSSDNSSTSQRRNQRLPKTRRKEGECAGEEESNSRRPLAKFKRKQPSEDDANLGEREKKRRKKDGVNSSADSKSKHAKERGNTEGYSEKESRKHKKEKKKAEASGPTEEEMLWDESILGF